MDKRRNALRITLGAVVVLLILFFGLTYQVREGQSAIVTRFGKPVSVVEQAGLHLKLPWPLERSIVLDSRRRIFNTRHTEMLTRDKKNVILLTYVVWSVDDPLKFYQSIGSIEAADSKLDGLITNAKISTLGRFDLSALVSTEPDDLKVSQIEGEILSSSAGPAKEKYGVLIEEVGFKRLSLPEGNTRYVFEQMRAERKQYAARFRAEGEREASKIRAETDLEVATIRAEAKEEAARIRGEAEAEAAKIYSEAHSVDPDFYRFLRSLDTMEKIVGKKTTVILRTDSEPFSLMKSQTGR